MSTGTTVVVSVIGLAVVGVGGFLYYNWNKKRQEQQQLDTAASTAAAAAVSVSSKWQQLLDQENRGTPLAGAGGVQILR